MVEKLTQSSTDEKNVLARAVLFAVRIGCEDGCALGCIDGSNGLLSARLLRRLNRW